MRASTLLTSFLSATLASARIVGISAPSTIAPNSTFTLTLLTEGYIQSVADVAVAYGFQLPTAKNPTGFPKTLGSYTGSVYLGPTQSNTQDNVQFYANADAGLENEAYNGKDVVLTVAAFSLYGASGSTTTTGWNVTEIGRASCRERVSQLV